MQLDPLPLPPLQPIRADGKLRAPHLVMRRLYRESADRRGNLVNAAALAAVLRPGKGGEGNSLSPAMISMWFGRTASSTPDRERVEEIVAAFRADGVPVELAWMYQDYEVFAAYMDQHRTTVHLRTSWLSLAWRWAQAFEGLKCERAIGQLLGVVQPHESQRDELPSFRVGEQVVVTVKTPQSPLRARCHAVLLEDDFGIECVFPNLDYGDMSRSGRLQIPTKGEPFRVTGPAGVQTLFAVVSSFTPRTRPHRGLTGPELNTTLDALADDLVAYPTDQWRILSSPFQVVG